MENSRVRHRAHGALVTGNFRLVGVNVRDLDHAHKRNQQNTQECEELETSVTLRYLSRFAQVEFPTANNSRLSHL